jgi:hypothetical protein
MSASNNNSKNAAEIVLVAITSVDVERLEVLAKRMFSDETIKGDEMREYANMLRSITKNAMTLPY